MGVYVRAKFEVSSVILTSFRQRGRGVILPPTPLPPTQNEPLKNPPRLELTKFTVVRICLVTFFKAAGKKQS